MKLPKVYNIYLNPEYVEAAGYCDYGAQVGRFGLRPYIYINRTKVKSSFYFFECMCHEMFHFFVRPLPLWLERIFDICIDVTEGGHSKVLVYDLFLIFKTPRCECEKIV